MSDIDNALERLGWEQSDNGPYVYGLDDHWTLDSSTAELLITQITKAERAAEKRLLDELESKLPDGRAIVQPDISEVPDGALWIYFKGQKYVIDQISGLIAAKRDALNNKEKPHE